MNDYQKAIKRGIETGLDNHFPKKEPKKVWLTVEEAKTLLECAYCVDAYTFAKCKKLFDCLKKQIEQAEKCDA